MRALVLAVAACVSMGLLVAVPAAAVPIDPGRMLVQASAPASIDTAAVTAMPARDLQAPVMPSSPSLIGDRPADGAPAVRLVSHARQGTATSFNLTIVAGTG